MGPELFNTTAPGTIGCDGLLVGLPESERVLEMMRFSAFSLVAKDFGKLEVCWLKKVD